ncbi:RNB domain-containing ribonuclease [Methylobacterium brachiatum]
MATNFKGVTIDPVGAADLDDAIWVDRDGAGWTAEIAFPKLTEYVPIGGRADVAARQRLFTNYLADGARHMLPMGVVEAASLTAEKGKPVFLTRIVLDRSLKATSLDCGKAIFRSRQRLTYDEASALVRGGEGRIAEMLGQARDLAHALFEARRTSGAIAYYDLEKGIAFDEEGGVILMSGQGHVAEMIVREFMVLANSTLAAYAAREGIPLLYRNHRALDDRTREQILSELEGSIDVADADVALAGRPRLMARARLGVEPEGHYGLNLPAYAWFTSPLRRFADLVNQRMLGAHLEGRPAPYDETALREIADAINARQDEVLDRRAAGYRARTERAAGRLIASGEMADASPLDFRRVVRAVAADPSNLNEAVVEEGVRRIEAGVLTAKEMARLLVLGGQTGEAVVARLRANPHDAPNVLNYGVMAMGWSQPAFTETRGGSAHAGVFACTGRIEHDGVEHVTPAVVRPTRKAAQHSAAVHLLASIAGLEVPPEPASPEPAPTVEAQHRPASTIPDQNPRNRLQEHCAKRGLALPSYQVTERGPPHDRLFEAVTTVHVGGKVLVSPAATAKSRKEAEKAAAAEMLVLIGVDGGIARPASPPVWTGSAPGSGSSPATTVDPAVRTRLETLCAHRGWEKPHFEVRGSGPPHKPAFDAVATVQIGGRQMRSASFRAGSKKEAERAAAAAMLADLEALPRRA